MEGPAHARVVLAQLAARRFGRAVPAAVLLETLEREGVTPAAAAAALEKLLSERLAYETHGGILPTAPRIATRAPSEAASFARLHR